MPRCKNCGQFGLFLKLSPEGLCEQCMPIVDNIITSCARTMNDSLNKLEKTNDFNLRLQYCNLLFENAVRLQEYENRGIPTIKPKPSIFISECEKIKKDLHQQSLSQDQVC